MIQAEHVRSFPTVEADREVESLAHRELLDGEWWRHIPAYADVDEETFLDHRWQTRNSVKSVNDLRVQLGELVSAELLEDVSAGVRRAPMSLRITPYLISLIDWNDPVRDPIRRQFLPLGSTAEPDHPELRLDSLAEQADAATPGLVHRYPDKALFLVLDSCPVYCRFCTRSYAVGMDTEQVDKVALRPNPKRWEQAFAYIEATPRIEDLVLSGGDVYNLGARFIRDLGMRLLAIPHVRRIRYATKGLAVMPQKILSDQAWVDALTEVSDHGRQVGKQVAVHTHFNTAREITSHSQRALNSLFARGVTVRNQSVLQRGVNDSAEDMAMLVRRLGYVNVEPYYVYIHDLVAGVEELRTTVASGIHIEKAIRGLTAGFNTPTFVVDAPGGGGKRDIHSYEHYDQRTGASIYTAPGVKPGQSFVYFDPVSQLPDDGRSLWQNEHARHRFHRDLTRRRNQVALSTA